MMRSRGRRSASLLAGIVIGFAVVGVAVAGVLVGATIRSAPSLAQSVRTRLILNGTLRIPDFPVTFMDGSSTTLYQEADASDMLVVSFVSVGCAHCEEELMALSGTSRPQVSSARVRYLAVCSDPEEILRQFFKEHHSYPAIGRVDSSVLTRLHIDLVPEMVVVDQGHHVVGSIRGFDKNITLHELQELLTTSLS